ncbi:protein FANTASTIC FOUR 1 [Diospyros lotus]|uniref:protein FANTASTIC FOUR 1 n=1 Tax=Diospyros lotus TaxID=55363 RepID=UPI002251E66F|nr:protein FANTASTIC FOUR 1 [Diospyros lotus]
MSKVVFKSCLEIQQQQQQLMETRTLKLKLASPKPSFFESFGEEKSHYPETSSCYVHPMAKRSLSQLSHKSLELCTENLGSETGSDICESSIFSISSPVGEISPAKARQEMESSRKEIKNSRSFPPPLTTMVGGSSSLQVRPHRVDGRLVIEAVEVPPAHTHLQAERIHGRLRLSFWKDCSSSEEDEEAETENNEASHEEEEEEEEEEEDAIAETDELFEFEFHEEEEEEEEGEGRDVNGKWEDMEGNSLEVGVEMGIKEKFQRPSRCKDGRPDGKRIYRVPFWVATS